MRYGDLRWTDIETLDKDRVVVVCPTASLEQHGHHLPLLTDTYLVTAVAEHVEQQLSAQVLLTPTLWLGASDHHLDFPGTLSVPPTLYSEMIRNLVRCFAKARFRRVLFLNGHGGNLRPGEVALSEVANQSDPNENILVAIGNYWTIAAEALMPEKHGMQTPQLTHACEYETSMMLAVRPELVHLQSAVAGPPVFDSPSYHSERGGRVSLAFRFHRLTPTGAMGQPQFANLAKGQSLLQAAVEEVTKFVREFLTWQLPEVQKR